MAEEQVLSIEQLLTKVKEGLTIPSGNTFFDNTLKQKILGVKSYMLGAGLSEKQFGDNADESNDGDSLAITALVLGVSDIWNLSSGDVKFSAVFNAMVTQLAAGNPDLSEEETA